MKGKMKSDIKVEGSEEMKRDNKGYWGDEKVMDKRKVGESVNIKKKKE